MKEGLLQVSSLSLAVSMVVVQVEIRVVVHTPRDPHRDSSEPQQAGLA